MLSVKVLSGSFLSICDIFLSISDTLSKDCVNENIIDHMLSLNLSYDIFLSIFDTLSIDCYNEYVIDLIVSINVFLGSLLLISDKFINKI